MFTFGLFVADDEDGRIDMGLQEEGIGNENILRRLELIYPNKHSFMINQNQQTFKAVLKLWK